MTAEQHRLSGQIGIQDAGEIILGAVPHGQECALHAGAFKLLLKTVHYPAQSRQVFGVSLQIHHIPPQIQHLLAVAVYICLNFFLQCYHIAFPLVCISFKVDKPDTIKL